MMDVHLIHSVYIKESTYINVFTDYTYEVFLMEKNIKILRSGKIRMGKYYLNPHTFDELKIMLNNIHMHRDILGYITDNYDQSMTENVYIPKIIDFNIPCYEYVDYVYRKNYILHEKTGLKIYYHTYLIPYNTEYIYTYIGGMFTDCLQQNIDNKHNLLITLLTNYVNYYNKSPTRTMKRATM